MNCPYSGSEEPDFKEEFTQDGEVVWQNLTPARHAPALPKFMAGLPVDKKRGFVVPWFVEWINGEPEFRAMDPRKMTRAINERLCWVCGNKLFGEEVYVIGPMCVVNRISSEPPSHRECARYSAQVCPFLSKPQMVRRESGLPVPVEELRNAVPGLMVARNPGATALWFTRNHTLLPVKNGVLWQLGRPFKIEWYSRGREATREEVMESFESGLPILYEQARKDEPGAVAHLERLIVDARMLLP